MYNIYVYYIIIQNRKLRLGSLNEENQDHKTPGIWLPAFDNKFNMFFKSEDCD